ncbi:SCO family protein [Tropicibacter oceani]|uniref:SCO family protein n=1 Tax=Tropicibacter oceani TaxID=3058420 RepID=A0ABY8QJ37_9RHOB|nr:SCO family protein [Tropicibacter oceani]WGW04554.1 SCO family protein [Tropicibacter oceani]
MRRLAFLSASVAIVGLMGGVWYATMGAKGGDQFAQCRSTAIAGGSGQIGGPLTLVNKDGETVTDADFITEPTLLYFGYTFCPDVCPLDTVRNADAVDVLADRGYSVTPVFVTIDPNRDTPQAVGDFAANIHEKMIGLTGSEEQIKAASQTYRTYYKRQPGEDDYYLVDHSTFTYLVLPDHGFVEYFRREVSPDEMATKVACFVDAS